MRYGKEKRDDTVIGTQQRLYTRAANDSICSRPPIMLLPAPRVKGGTFGRLQIQEYPVCLIRWHVQGYTRLGGLHHDWGTGIEILQRGDGAVGE